jgi:hypothetical protein
MQSANAGLFIANLLEAKKLADGTLKGAYMEPTILAVQNPGEETILIPQVGTDLEDIIINYGSQFEHGAFVALIEKDAFGQVRTIRQFVVDKITDGQTYLQDNSYMSEDGAANVDHIGAVVSAGFPDDPTPEEELETFTVYGVNDDDEAFSAVVSATESTVESVGVQAGLVDEGFESHVKIVAILKGDQTDQAI